MHRKRIVYECRSENRPQNASRACCHEAQQQAMAEAEQRWAQTQTIEQHQLQLIALRTDAMRIPR
jgi:hypothetical protein